MALSNFDIYSVLAAEHSRISSGPSDTEVAKDTVPKSRRNASAMTIVRVSRMSLSGFSQKRHSSRKKHFPPKSATKTQDTKCHYASGVTSNVSSAT
jgi:hypothetical protein